MKKTLSILLAAALCAGLCVGCRPLSAVSTPPSATFATNDWADLMENSYDIEPVKVELRDGKTLSLLAVFEGEEAIDTLEGKLGDAMDLWVDTLSMGGEFPPDKISVSFARNRDGKADYRLDVYAVTLGDDDIPSQSFPVMYLTTSQARGQLSLRLSDSIFADAHRFPGLFSYHIPLSPDALEAVNQELDTLALAKNR